MIGSVSPYLLLFLSVYDLSSRSPVGGTSTQPFFGALRVHSHLRFIRRELLRELVVE